VLVRGCSFTTSSGERSVLDATLCNLQKYEQETPFSFKDLCKLNYMMALKWVKYFEKFKKKW
jgi:hypothetical protein